MAEMTHIRLFCVLFLMSICLIYINGTPILRCCIGQKETMSRVILLRWSRKFYGGISQNNLCFLVEVNARAIGDCWLQKMNLPNVREMYADSTDVRRIDMMIGEKNYWGKGIGTLFIGMLVKYAFECEQVDVLHCFCEDYNIRSRRVWEKNGFTLIFKEEVPQPHKGKLQYHWKLTKDEYDERRFAHNDAICSPPKTICREA